MILSGYNKTIVVWKGWEGGVAMYRERAQIGLRVFVLKPLVSCFGMHKYFKVCVCLCCYCFFFFLCPRELLPALTEIDREIIRKYQRIMLEDPSNFNAHFNIGILYYRNNLFDEAIREFKKVIEINPDDSEAYYNLGNIFNKRNSMTMQSRHTKRR